MACIYIENVPCYFDLQETVAYLRRPYSMGLPTGIQFHMTRASSLPGEKKATIHFREVEDAHRLLDGDMYWPTAHRIMPRLENVDIADFIRDDNPLPPSGCNLPTPVYGSRSSSKCKISRMPPPYRLVEDRRTRVAPAIRD